jgi:hypothetical protein
LLTNADGKALGRPVFTDLATNQTLSIIRTVSTAEWLERQAGNRALWAE